MEKIKIHPIIIVEGRYDKNLLSQIFDTIIIETCGFGIFKAKDKLELIRKLAQKRQVLILTDSDSAGFLIRNHLKGVLPSDRVLHAYIPEIFGKEKRKAQVSKEGLLGVEGVDKEIILSAVGRAGVKLGWTEKFDKPGGITSVDFYRAGLLGGKGSAQKRRDLLKQLGLPGKLSTSAMIEVVNAMFTEDEFWAVAEQNQK